MGSGIHANRQWGSACVEGFGAGTGTVLLTAATYRAEREHSWVLMLYRIPVPQAAFIDVTEQTPEAHLIST